MKPADLTAEQASRVDRAIVILGQYGFSHATFFVEDGGTYRMEAFKGDSPFLISYRNETLDHAIDELFVHAGEEWVYANID